MAISNLHKEREDPLVRRVLDPILPALGVGAFAGTSGLAVGLITGSLRSAHPALFAAFSGAQWFGLGTTFWYTRSVLANTYSVQQVEEKQRIISSTAAGLLTGGINGAFRSRSNIIPGGIMLGLMGFAGQYGYSAFVDQAQSETERKSLLQRFAEMKWVPLKSLSNEEYEQMLNEKLLSIEAEISIIDERIATLRSSQRTDPPKLNTKPP